MKLLTLIGGFVVFSMACQPVQSSTHQKGPIDPEPSQLSDWAGVYVKRTGTTFDFRLNLQSDGQFTLKSRGCFGDYPGDSGIVIIAKAALLNQQSRSKWDLERRHWPVKWGDRQFLIADRELLQFCEAYRRGWRGELHIANDGIPYFMKVDDAMEGLKVLSPLSSPPLVPDHVKSLLITELGAKVLSSSGDVVTLDKGLDHGVAVGSLWRTSTGTTFQTDSATKETSKCEALQPIREKLTQGARLLVYAFPDRSNLNSKPEYR